MTMASCTGDAIIPYQGSRSARPDSMSGSGRSKRVRTRSQTYVRRKAGGNGAPEASERPEVELQPHGLKVQCFENESDAFAVIELAFRGWGDPDPNGMLSRAERAVVMLALDGLSNQEIARARGTSLRTVANQIASIFRKLGVGSRPELFVLAASSLRSDRTGKASQG